jgi:hypothetical protein
MVVVETKPALSTLDVTFAFLCFALGIVLVAVAAIVRKAFAGSAYKWILFLGLTALVGALVLQLLFPSSAALTIISKEA